MSDDKSSETDLVARAAAGTLLHDLNQDKDLIKRAIALHQAGTIDLLATLETQTFADLNGPGFFAIQRLLCDAIPSLDAPVPAMMAAVKKLVDRGGRDMAAQLPLRAFRVWLERDMARAQEIVAISESGAKVDRNFLSAAAEALGDAALAERWAMGSDLDRRMAGLATLGNLTPTGAGETARRIDALLSFADGKFDEDTRFVAILGAYRLIEKTPNLAFLKVPHIIKLVGASPSDAALLALVRGLWIHEKVFSAHDVASALALLADNLDGKPSLPQELDMALGQLIERGHRDAVLNILTKLLGSATASVTLGTFSDLKHHLRQQDRNFLFALAVRWFRTANRGLCGAVVDLIGGAHEVAPFDTTMAGFGLSGDELVVLCHKVIAYMLLTPVLATSFIVAALRVGDKAAEDKLTDLLTNVILKNYGGKVRDYLKGTKKGDDAHAAARKALKANGVYLKGLDISAPIKELYPSPAQRGMVRLKQLEMGRQIRKRAEAQSVLMSLVHRSTILYGHRSLSYVGGKDKDPVVMDLKAFSTAFDMPRLDVIDPVGLDFMIRIFRRSKVS